MSDDTKINIQLQLETVLSAIENGNGKILSEIISKLLLADYEIFNNLNQLGSQIAEVTKNVKAISDQLLNLEFGDLGELEEIDTEEEITDAD